jgi:hypothetical protein
MGVLDFLFQGQAPQSTTQYGTSQSNVPSWLQEYSQGVLAQANALAGQPYTPYQGPRVAGFTGDQQKAQQEVSNLQGGYLPTLNSATSLAKNSANPSAISAGLGYLPGAQSYLQGALAPTQAQMNPYIGNVINQAQTQAKQFWQNQLQPSIQNQFTAAGQYGSSADEMAQEQAANQLTENLQATAGAQLAQGYNQAQNVGLQAAGLQGNLGQIAGGLGYEGGVLGLQGASQLGQLASEGQTLGLQGAGALDTSGQEQQQLNQQNLGLGYQDFLNQQNYPYQQLGWLDQTLMGTATPNTVPYSSTTGQTGYAPQYSASPLAQSIGLYNMTNGSGYLRGGRVNPRGRRRHGGYLPVRRAA